MQSHRGVLALGWPLAVMLAACSDDAAIPSARGIDADAGTSDGGPACAAGQMLLSDGRCKPAGIATDACSGGFAADDSGGCEPILPASVCPPGTMAVPGEATCRGIAPCERGSWGNVPVDGTTQFVDGSYGGGDTSAIHSRSRAGAAPPSRSNATA